MTTTVASPDKTAKLPSILTLASIAVVIAALYLAKAVLIPLTLAILLSFLLSPVCDGLERCKLGRIPAVLVTAILGFTILGSVVWMAAVQITAVAPKIPDYQRNIEAKFSSVNEYAVAALSKVIKTAQGMGQKVSPSETANEPRGTNELPFSVRIISTPCVSATPPAAVMHARHLCKRLRGRLAELNLVVGLWDAKGDVNKSKERIGCDASVVATLADAQAKIRLMIEQPKLRSRKQVPPERGPMVAAGA